MSKKINLQIYRANGNRFEGQFKFEKKNGQGMIVYADGIIKKGEWKDDELVKLLD